MVAVRATRPTRNQLVGCCYAKLRAMVPVPCEFAHVVHHHNRCTMPTAPANDTVTVASDAYAYPSVGWHLRCCDCRTATHETQRPLECAGPCAESAHCHRTERPRKHSTTVDTAASILVPLACTRLILHLGNKYVMAKQVSVVKASNTRVCTAMENSPNNATASNGGTYDGSLQPAVMPDSGRINTGATHTQHQFVHGGLLAHRRGLSNRYGGHRKQLQPERRPLLSATRCHGHTIGLPANLHTLVIHLNTLCGFVT